MSFGNTFMDALNPTTIQPSGAKRIYLLGPEEVKVPKDLEGRRIYNKLKAQKSRRIKHRSEVSIETLEQYLRGKHIRRLREKIRKQKVRLALTEKELEDYLNG